ncbi:MAG: 3-hydroxyacyl-CoA dehydrogenase NAD-binding domain-containing protein, partial [Sulfurifustis sp.]
MSVETPSVVRPIERTVLRHWRLEFGQIDTSGRLIGVGPDEEIGLLTLDVADQSANTLTREVMEEFDRLLTSIASRHLRGLIIRSGKPSGFAAGADVREFGRVTDAAEAAELAREGQRVLDRLAALSFPSVALIHGFCMGGGLELAAACHYRIARDDAGTRLGLPEVRLGIHPGFAGTVRLPALIGHLPALDLMLTGRAVAARAALRLGLLDEVVPERHALYAAQSFLRRRPPRGRASWHRRIVGFNAFRPMVARMLARRLQARVNPHHYPAPYRILELWRNNATAATEAISLGELLVGRTSRNLVHVFLLGEELKRQGRARTHDIERVHVIGAGVMGADIAIWAAARGFQVSLQDQKPEILARAVSRGYKFFQRRLREPRLVQQAMDRLVPDLAGDGLRRADLVIEAIVEKIEPKREVLRHAERVAPKSAVLATNTSSIPLETLAEALADPSRLVGLHFFNPVARMQLIELVRGERTAQTVLDRARAWAVAIDRFPLDVTSSPGFLVNRVLTPYLLEAVKLLEEG